ncbi:MAG: UDP-2,3-diacylglucosamine diphosphatase LpxI [Planctomycetaceae bacterium]|nr:UDP-2,3-diacylglucosamine diphosphatase LpxI [Planctomycetaceae bacterium]MBT6487876.1 UDP-2,3-diacylglucosamine diphosphatase LpxI [Planctomycetaceae bacterium]MBT6493953.1 UDP-2,3-diacylglucosamine diphosphatase LpxI [Planctomycetaceae bacterium]
MTANSTTQPERVGLLAGSGQFPIHFAKAAKAQGFSVHCVGVLGLVPDELSEICDGFSVAPLGRVGKAIRLFKRAGVKRAVMAGKIEKTALFERFRWIRNFPDLRALSVLFRYARKDKTDDTLLLAIIREFARDNIIFESALNFCPELLVKHGFLTRRKPSPAQWRDIKFGWKMAKEMGKLDIGQTVVIKDTAVIAVEAIEGTDAAIGRAGQLCKRGGLTVVKVAKPQQDMRFDVPTIGVQTLQTMHESGARVLAIESDMTIMLNQEEVAKLADKLGIAIVALNADELKLRIAS